MDEKSLSQPLQELVDVDPKNPLLKKSFLEEDIQDSLQTIAADIQNILGKYAQQEGRFQPEIAQMYQEIQDHRRNGDVFHNDGELITAKIKLTSLLWEVPYIHEALFPYLEKRSTLKSALWKIRKLSENPGKN